MTAIAKWYCQYAEYSKQARTVTFKLLLKLNGQLVDTTLDKDAKIKNCGTLKSNL